MAIPVMRGFEGTKQLGVVRVPLMDGLKHARC
jgi:hypothetical protein